MRRLVSILLFALLAATLAAGAGCGVDTGEYASKATPTPGADDDDDDDGGNPSGTPAPGGGDPTPNPTATPSIAGSELEPNDDHDTANAVSGSFSGTCGGDDVFDIFTLPVATGGKTVTATITYSDAAEDDLDLYVSNYDYSLDLGDETVAPGDSPAEVSLGFPAAEGAFVEVFCYWTLNSVPYTGTVTVQ